MPECPLCLDTGMVLIGRDDDKPAGIRLPVGLGEATAALPCPNGCEDTAALQRPTESPRP